MMASRLLWERHSLSDDRGHPLRDYIIVLIILTLASIILRFVSRSLRSDTTPSGYKSSFWWDDWVALCAVPVILAQFIATLVMIGNGFGHHVEALPPANITLILKIFYAGNYLFDSGIALAKASALLFLWRVFPPSVNQRWYNIALWAVQTANVAWWIGIVVATVFLCEPIEKNWYPTIEGSCVNSDRVYIGSAVASVFIDFVILLLPLPKIWRLRLGRSRKAGLFVIFVLGYGIIVVSIGRTVTVLTSQKAFSEDVTYAAIPLFYWFSTEPAVSMICICLPAMLGLGRSLVSAYFSPLASKLSTVWSYRGTGYYSSFRSRSGSLNGNSNNDKHSVRLRPMVDDEPLNHSTIISEPNTDKFWPRSPRDPTGDCLEPSGIPDDSALQTFPKVHDPRFTGIRVDKTVQVSDNKAHA
ncbi:hypothetical protein F5Y10DRAFT_237654 [Nemania abortiva]|nr:hypothetical protein F5Y10DRAFT_237654 [Nemania abortiva]